MMSSASCACPPRASEKLTSQVCADRCLRSACPDDGGGRAGRNRAGGMRWRMSAGRGCREPALPEAACGRRRRVGGACDSGIVTGPFRAACACVAGRLPVLHNTAARTDHPCAESERERCYGFHRSTPSAWRASRAGPSSPVPARPSSSAGCSRASRRGRPCRVPAFRESRSGPWKDRSIPARPDCWAPARASPCPLIPWRPRRAPGCSGTSDSRATPLIFHSPSGRGSCSLPMVAA